MFRKILFLLLLVSAGVSAQRVGPDYGCFNIETTNISSGQKYIKVGDSYKVCKNQTVTPVPELEVQYLNGTDKYDVTQITYEPYALDPAVNGGTEIVPDTERDTWHDSRTQMPIELPFKFSFFGIVYDKIHVWSNGAVTFYEGPMPPLDFNNLQYESALNDNIGGPIPSTNTKPLFWNSIFGTFQHTHWDRTQYNTGGSINWQVYGEAPCRVFVVSFFRLTASGVNATFCPPPVPYQSHQIVMHETTNVIDVHVVQHDACPSHIETESLGLLGILNADNTVAYTAPNKNYTNFDAARESYRFAPSGDPMWYVEWYVNDKPSADGTVIVDAKKEIIGYLVVNTSDEEYKEAYKITVEPAVDVNKIDLEYIVCEKNQDVYDLNLITQAIKNAQTTEEGKEILKFLYYPTKDDATNKSNEIKDIKNYPIKGEANKVTENPVFVRIEVSGLDDCFEILPAVIIKAPVDVIVKPDVNLCDEYTLPVLTNDEFYFKLERLDEDAKFVVETISNPHENQVINKAGFYKVYVKKTNDYGCEDVKTYVLFVESCSFPKGISPNGDGDNDYLDLTYNNVIDLKIYNRYGKLVYKHGKGYKRQWVGQDSNGKQLPSGTYFLYVKTKDSEYQDWIQLIYEVKN